MSAPEITSGRTALALALHLLDVGLVQYTDPEHPGAAYIEDPLKPACFLGRMDQSPTSAVAIVGYYEDRSSDRYNPDVYVQLKFRAEGADPLALDDMAARFAGLLDWGEHPDPEVWPNDLHVLRCRRTSNTPADNTDGRDYTRYDSYRITTSPKGN